MSLETSTSTSNYVLSYEGYECPEQYVNDFTPQEFEELVEMFLTYDADGSQTVDRFELKKLLNELGADIGDNNVQRILNEVDSDGSGEIDFGEFVALHARIRRGDSRLFGLNALAARLQQSPLAILASQAVERQLRIRYELVEERAATALHPAIFIMEVVLRGIFYDFDAQTQTAQRFDGEKRVQGLGRTTREARVNAAKNALSRMKAVMPGMNFEPGLLPQTWISWLRSNVRRGVHPKPLLQTLRAKGWHPSKNHSAMQYLICCHSLQVRHRRLMPPRVREWALKMRERGADGICVRDALEDHKMTDDVHTIEYLRLQGGRPPKSKYHQRISRMDFWSCVCDGHVEDVDLYLLAGQDPNAIGKPHGDGDVAMPAIHHAAKFGRAKVVERLLDAGVDVNMRDLRGRTAVMLAAFSGQEEMVKLLHELGADLHLGDKSGGTAMHFAALAAREGTLKVLLTLEADMLRKVTSGEILAFFGNVNLAQTCAVEFVAMQDEKLKMSEARAFRKSWLLECAQRCLNKLLPDMRRHVGVVTTGHLNHCLSLFDPNPGSGFTKGDDFIPTVSNANDLFIIIKDVFRQCGLDMVDRRGWTPLHAACFENKEDTHEGVLRLLVNSARTDLLIVDHAGRKAFDLLCMPRGRPATPTGAPVVEALLAEKREIIMQQLEEEAERWEEEQRRLVQQKRLHEALVEGMVLNKDAWKVMRETSQKRRTLGGFVEYEDHDSGVLFYGPEDILDAFGDQLEDEEDDEGGDWDEGNNGVEKNKQANCVVGEDDVKKESMTLSEILARSVEGYSWSKSRAFRIAECIWQGWACIRRQSVFVRKLGTWDVMRDAFSRVEFYAHGITDECTLAPPAAATWPAIYARSNLLQKLGVVKEWHEMEDPDGNVFYFCGATQRERYCWHRPVEASDEFPKCCSSVVFNGSEALQAWYTCDVCNQILKARGENAGIMRVCISCAKLCHSGPGHKVRFVRESVVACNCMQIECKCQASEMPEQHLIEKLHEERRKEEITISDSAKSPTILAFVPLKCRDSLNTLKRIRGWHICNAVPRDHGTVHELRLKVEKSTTLSSRTESQLAALGRKDLPHSFIFDGWITLYDPESSDESEIFFFNVNSGESSWTMPTLASDSNVNEDHWRFPDHDGAEWYQLAKNTSIRKKRGPINEYEDEDSLTLWYAERHEGNMEYNALALQRWWRKLRGSSATTPWQSRVFSYDPPDVEAFMRVQMEEVAWALLRRRSRLVAELTDVEGLVWEELFDPVHKVAHYFHETTHRSTWERPKLPAAPTTTGHVSKGMEPLDVGANVFYTFAGDNQQCLCVVIKLREDDETGERCYDVESREHKARRKKWVRRQQLHQAAKSAEEIQEEFEKKLWTQQLRRARAAERRKAQREKAMNAEKKRALSRGGRDRPPRRVWTEAEKLAAREERAKAEANARQLREEAAENERQEKLQETLAMRAGASAAAVAASKTGGGLFSEAALMAVEAGSESPETTDSGKESFQSIRVEEVLAEREDAMTTPRTQRRRRLLRCIHRAMIRQRKGFTLCEWGCGVWTKHGAAQRAHEAQACVKRVLPCNLGCGVSHTAENWQKVQDDSGRTLRIVHEQDDCVRRLVPCTRRCGEWLAFEDLEAHLNNTCVKRPFPPLKCRHGCGMTFAGGGHAMLQSEEARLSHEMNDCPKRLIRCNWPTGCVALIRADERKRHRERHVQRTGIFTFRVTGQHSFVVPSATWQLKLQLWGGGGGSGRLCGRKAGAGGGAAYVEALVAVTPGETLEITVGAGGSGGVCGYKDKELGDVEGVANGGEPGGGIGYGGNEVWAAGGGGGFSMVRRQRDGLIWEPVVVAGGGGGGGSRDGVPGGGVKGEIPNTLLDLLNGRMGSSYSGGDAGDAGDIAGCKWPPSSGSAWQGGHGAQFGGGGGGGIFGGGGGGATPGIVGGGGGGGSFADDTIVLDFMAIQGRKTMPGGYRDIEVPQAVGIGEWDQVEGLAGEGGRASVDECIDGNNGAVRIRRPGLYNEEVIP